MEHAVSLNQVVVRSNSHKSSAATELVQYSQGQGSPLCWIGSCANFVQQHKRSVVHLLQHVHQSLDLSRECAQVSPHVLFVTYFGKYAREHRPFAAISNRDVQSGLDHGSKKTQSLERYRLTTGVGTADDQGLLLFIEMQINGHNFDVIRFSSFCKFSPRHHLSQFDR